MDTTSAPDAVAKLQVRVHRLTLTMAVSVIALPLLVTFAWTRFVAPSELSLRTLRIVDERGVERVRIDGHLPDVVNGKRVTRGEQAAGLIIYDDAGDERGGYVTFSPSRNAVLTLDTRKGMVVLLAADSADGAALRLSRSNVNDWIDLRAGSTGPHLTVGRGNEVTLQEPPMSEGDAAALWAEFNVELSKLKVQPPDQALLQVCEQRMLAAACRHHFRTH